MKNLDLISICENSGIYVKDTEQSKIRLIRGPCSYMLDVHEVLWQKKFSDEEIKAGLPREPSHVAYTIRLQKNEALCLLDTESNVEKYILGPCIYVLAPLDSVKTIGLSAGKPKVSNAITVSTLRLGPDFTSDSFQVRTKDNAQLTLLVSYKWQFLVTPETASRVFQMNDFIGYACQTMCGIIRE